MIYLVKNITFYQYYKFISKEMLYIISKQILRRQVGTHLFRGPLRALAINVVKQSRSHNRDT